MSRPKNKDEFRKELAEAFANILEEKGLDWKKEWNGGGNMAPYNGVTKAHYRGINNFWLRLLAMERGYNDPRWVTMVQIMDKDNKYHPGQKWHLKAGSKATYVEYWYPWDIKGKAALTWQQYREALNNGRTPEEFTLRSRYTAVFNGSLVEGMLELEKPPERDIPVDRIIENLAGNMGVRIRFNGGDRATIRQLLTIFIYLHRTHLKANTRSTPQLCTSWPTPPAIPRVSTGRIQASSVARPTPMKSLLRR